MEKPQINLCVLKFNIHQNLDRYFHLIKKLPRVASKQHNILVIYFNQAITIKISIFGQGFIFLSKYDILSHFVNRDIIFQSFLSTYILKFYKLRKTTLRIINIQASFSIYKKNICFDFLENKLSKVPILEYEEQKLSKYSLINPATSKQVTLTLFKKKLTITTCVNSFEDLNYLYLKLAEIING